MESVDQIKEALAENLAIKEMIDTETSYNNALQFLETVLAMDELVKDIPVLVKFKTIIPQLKFISDKLLTNVKETLELPNQHPQRNRLKEQRTQLLKAFFQLYPLCSQLYLEYAQGEAELSEHLNDIKKYVSQHNPLRLDLAAFLIQAVQRGPRYAMLVSAAITYNEKLIEGHSSKLNESQIAALQDLFSIIQDLLIEANSIIPSLKEAEKEELKPYEFGDISKAIVEMVEDYLYSEPMPQEQEQVTEVLNLPPPVKEYQFGDHTRRTLNFFLSLTETLSKASSNTQTPSISPPKPDSEDSEEVGFTINPFSTGK